MLPRRRDVSDEPDVCHRDVSDELDVFEASRYFSGGLDGISATSHPVGHYYSNTLMIRTIPPPLQAQSKLEQFRKDEATRYFSGGLDSIVANGQSVGHYSNTPMTRTMPHPLQVQSKLQQFRTDEATRNFSSALDSIAANGHVIGRCFNTPMIRTTPHPLQVQSKLQQFHKEDKKKQPSSPSAKLTRFVNSIFRKTKTKPTTPMFSQAKPLKTDPLFHSNIPEKEPAYHACNTGIDVQARFREKSAKVFDGFVYRGVSKKSTDQYLRDNRIWACEGLSSKAGRKSFRKEGGRKSFRKLMDEVEDYDGDCKQSVCSSDLFELENYDVHDFSGGLPVYGETGMWVIKRELPCKC